MHQGGVGVSMPATITSQATMAQAPTIYQLDPALAAAVNSAAFQTQQVMRKFQWNASNPDTCTPAASKVSGTEIVTIIIVVCVCV